MIRNRLHFLCHRGYKQWTKLGFLYSVKIIEIQNALCVVVSPHMHRKPNTRSWHVCNGGHQSSVFGYFICFKHNLFTKSKKDNSLTTEQKRKPFTSEMKAYLSLDHTFSSAPKCWHKLKIKQTTALSEIITRQANPPTSVLSSTKKLQRCTGQPLKSLLYFASGACSSLQV